MKSYELVIVLDGKSASSKKKAVISKIEKLVETLKGKTGKVKDWGVKDLAYKIKKSVSGLFLIFSLELTGEAVSKLSEKIRVEEDIIRYLLVRK